MSQSPNTPSDSSVGAQIRYDDGIIVVFDSNCILCSHWIRFILNHEANRKIQFASARKPLGRKIAAQFGFQPEELDLTYLVIHHGQALTKSDASLALLGELRKPWSWLRALRFVPRPIRNGLYDVVARNRLRWFGEKENCLLLSEEERTRFLGSVDIEHALPEGESSGR